MTEGIEDRKGTGLRLVDGIILVVVGVVGVVVAFWVLGHIVGIIWGLIKIAVVVVVIVAVLALLLRRRR
jgi:multisubunit Na+/H+ antiporter MnhB subunit